ncbi:MAG TPA: type 4a pilus biogenesis protein PilO [Syntrophomonadaceae bacterium]|nr:type 4a pilus biogenesis protein PilO [Syntrophomonadaceae bacterium]
MNISRRDQGLLVVLIILLLGLAFYRFVYAPAGEDIKAATASNQELQLEKQRLTEVINAPAKPGDAEDKFTNLDKRLPTEDEMIPLLNLLDETIAECDLPFASLDYKGAEPNPSGVQTLVFTVGVKGSVYQLLNLLTMLENSDRLISVEDVSFTGVKLEQQQAGVSEAESGPPVYYIQPPGIPEAKLQRIKLEVVQEETPTAAAEPEQPVASSFLADNYDMKFTIKAYYADEGTTVPEGDSKKEPAKGAEGEV